MLVQLVDRLGQRFRRNGSRRPPALLTRAEELIEYGLLPLCFADIAIATYASVGQRILTIAPEKAPDGTSAVVIIRSRKGGPDFKYAIPASDLAKLGPMNKNLDPQGRWDAVMKEDGLFTIEDAP
jgi:hypothetical protein